MKKHAKPVPAVRRLLAVCAHPYDVTFALGGVIAAFTEAGTAVRVLCLTPGRHADPDPRRGIDRARDLGIAGRRLGAEDVTLLDHRPGTLAVTSIDTLAGGIVAAAGTADTFLTIDATGPGAHPDHVHTMRAAYRSATRVGAVLYAWTLGDTEAVRGRQVLVVDVDRERQRSAIACHSGLPDDDPLRSRWMRHREREERLVVLRRERELTPALLRRG